MVVDADGQPPFKGVKVIENPFGEWILELAADDAGFTPYLVGLALTWVGVVLAALISYNRYVAGLFVGIAGMLSSRFLIYLFNVYRVVVRPMQVELIRGRAFLRRSKVAALEDLAEVSYQRTYRKGREAPYAIFFQWKDGSQWQLTTALKEPTQAEWVVEQLRAWVEKLPQRLP